MQANADEKIKKNYGLLVATLTQRDDPPMPIRQLNLQCATCSTVMPHNQDVPNHIVHALVSLFLLGLWIPIWILVSIGSNPATCVRCGNRRSVSGPATVSAQPGAQPAGSQFGMMWTFVFIVAIVGGALVYGAVTGT